VNLSLRIRANGAKDRSVPLEGEALDFGRNDKNALVLSDAVVSDRHGRFVLREGLWHVVDLGSSNGTRRNGETVPVDELGQALEIGDQVEVGPFVLALEVVQPEHVEDPLRRPREPAKDTAASCAEQADRLEETLKELFAELADLPATARRSALRKELEARTRSWPKRQVAEVLTRLQRGEVKEARPQLREKQDQLLRASHDAVVALARSLTGSGRLDSVEEIERFEKLVRQGLEILSSSLLENIRSRMQYGDQTDSFGTILPGLGNPLYESEDAKDVMASLFDPRRDVRPRAVQKHLETVMQDLKFHQLALLDAARVATHRLMEELDPQRIEDELHKKRSRVTRLFGGAWNSYVALHGELSSEPQRFYELIEKWIREGYRVTVHRLRKEAQGA
jgi:predicted component of type VI protein secretion system